MLHDRIRTVVSDFCGMTSPNALCSVVGCVRWVLVVLWLVGCVALSMFAICWECPESHEEIPVCVGLGLLVVVWIDDSLRRRGLHCLSVGRVLSVCSRYCGSTLPPCLLCGLVSWVLSKSC